MSTPQKYSGETNRIFVGFDNSRNLRFLFLDYFELFFGYKFYITEKEEFQMSREKLLNHISTYGSLVSDDEYCSVITNSKTCV